MIDTYQQALVLAGLAVLFVLCLPFSSIQKLVLELSAWLLRLALVGLLAAGGYLLFRPADLPAEAANAANSFLASYPQLKGVVPEPGTRYFGACAATFFVSALLPLLAALDVSRKLAGRRLRRLRALTARPPVVEAVVAPAPVAVVQRVNRRTAADALAGAGTTRPLRAP